MATENAVDKRKWYQYGMGKQGTCEVCGYHRADPRVKHVKCSKIRKQRLMKEGRLGVV